MPSNEIKRQFTLGKMEKDKDDRLVEPGAYRDANNVDVSRSEGDDSGALQVVRGNVQPVNQDIDWSTRRAESDPDVVIEEFTELIKPFGETVGVYPYPQEEKVYFFNTGRPVDPDNPDIEQPLQNAIYEYDQVAGTVVPIIIETEMGDYEAGGAAVQEFVGELLDTQVFGKQAYQDDTSQTDIPFQYLKEVGIGDTNQAFISLTCSSFTVIDRDVNDNPIYHVDGNYCSPTCDSQGIQDKTFNITLAEVFSNELTLTLDGDPRGFYSIGSPVELSGFTGDNADLNGNRTPSDITADSLVFIYTAEDETIPSQDAIVTGQIDCQEANLFFEADNEAQLVCRVGGRFNQGDICDCSNVGVDDCDYAQYTEDDCPISGGINRSEEECVQTNEINDDLNYEPKSNLVLAYPQSTDEWATDQWTISTAPDTSIVYQLITQDDLNQTPVCTPKDDFPSYLNFRKYTLNGNGADLQPEEFCDPRCEIFQPETCVPDDTNNQCYPEYCRETPVLDSLYNTVFTDEAIEHNQARRITMTGVPNVGDGEVITATLKRLVPARTTLAATFDGVDEQWDFTAPEDNGRGVFTADNAIIIRGMDALDFQQFDSIFGNVGLASRPVGYTYRVARNGNVSWTPNSDEPFQVFPDPDTDTEAVLSNINPLDASIPAGGELGDNLELLVDVDRQQRYAVDTEEIDKDDYDEYGVDDLTELP